MKPTWTNISGGPPGRPRQEDGLLRAERERPAGRYRLFEDAAEITCPSHLDHEIMTFLLFSVRVAGKPIRDSSAAQIPFIGPNPIGWNSPTDRTMNVPGTSAYGALL